MSDFLVNIHVHVAAVLFDSFMVDIVQKPSYLMINKQVNNSYYILLLFDAFFPSFPLAESPPCDLQITAYK